MNADRIFDYARIPRPMWKPITILFSCLLLTLHGMEAVPSAFQSQNPKRVVQAFLIANSSTVAPSKTFQVGLLLQMPPGWHTFWKNPGSIGIPIAIDWKLPDGFKASALRWPVPEYIILEDGVVDYGYRGEVLLIAQIRPPNRLDMKEVTINGHVTWLACADSSCAPEIADLSLTLPVSTRVESKNDQFFRKSERLLPLLSNPPFPVVFSKYAGGIEIHAQPSEDVKRLLFFPLPAPQQLIGKISTIHHLPQDRREWVIRVPVNNGPLNGVLVAENTNNTREGYEFTDISPSSTLSRRIPAPGSIASSTLLQAIFYGFLGGLILNLMPCVLPVISLKIFGLIQQAEKNCGRIPYHGLAFAAGIFFWFFLLASLVLVLKSQGNISNWTAFQFQSPVFNLVVIVVTFVLALSMFGIFEVSIPSTVATGLVRLSEWDGLWGAFFHGTFTTLLATPCTSPFLGTALGLSLAQSNATAFAVFMAAATGMALPYLILSIQTSWIRLIPKPGLWMEWTKQLMGFPLLATIIWLLGVLGNQLGTSSIVATLTLLLLLAICCWSLGIFQNSRGRYQQQGSLPPWWLLLACLTIVASATYYLAWPHGARAYTTRAQGGKYSKIPWLPYSESVLHRAQAIGYHVFVNFTADWCLSCKFNEKAVLDRPVVIAAFQSKGIIPLKADWTNWDPVICAALHSFGRISVPLYVLYPAKTSRDPIILSELLTEAEVLNALEGLATSGKTIPLS
ncbi:MAG: thioredoxin family protein [Candidatus Xiphinematobacter sp.]|nr:MAG: thioredoxin family protein [Candidatus Xiphinematobacter sp.]QQY11021.1 MAG: thioredoxin family protein [Candidatus Xiphinematobacter sp.]